MPFKRLSILGFGLLGASVARATRKHIPACQISTYDPDRRSIELSADIGIVAASSAVEACRDADCIMLAVPPQNGPALLAEIQSAIAPEAIVTDVSSVKRQIVLAAEATLSRPERFVGGHPMAGGEKSGSAASRSELFRNAAIILTPTPRTDPIAVAAVADFWTSLGGRVLQMSPQAHDDAVATVSHLPHILASALMHVAGSQFNSIAGAGFRDVTRIAAGNPALWRDILIQNQDQIRPLLQSMQEQFQKICHLLDPARSDELEQWLGEACIARRLIDGEIDDSNR